MNVIQGIEAGVLLATTYAVELSEIGVPTPPIKIGHEWFVVEQVPPPVEALPPVMTSEVD